ncbi:Hypothetical predicted protein, partial [Paramuricea clavata]
MSMRLRHRPYDTLTDHTKEIRTIIDNCSLTKDKVSNFKKLNPKTWWSDIKRISGMKTCNRDPQSQLQIENIDHLSSKELANLINSTFLKPMGTYHPLRDEDLSNLYQDIPTDPPS